LGGISPNEDLIFSKIFLLSDDGRFVLLAMLLSSLTVRQ
jgi:hypothetical protein